MSLFFESNNHKIINEAKDRPKGVEFDLMKHASSDTMKDVLKKDATVGLLQQSQKDVKMSTTSTGVDINDSKIKSRIESFDKEKAKYILESKNIVEEYNIWINAEVDRMMNPNFIHPSQGTGEFLGKQLAYAMETAGLSKQEIKNYLIGTFYYTTDDPEKIKKMLTLRLEYNNKITSILQKMIQLNYKLLGYTEKEMEQLSSDLKSEDNKSNIAALEIKRRIYQNKSKFLTNGGECVDLTSLGFGKIFITKGKDFLGLNSNYAGANDNNELQAIDGLLQKAMKYDAIVMCHGFSANGVEYRVLQKRSKENIETSKKLGASQDQLDRMQKYDFDGKTIAKDNKDSVIKKRWVMQPIRSDKSDYYTDMNSFIARLIKEGYRKILIAACNPGSHKLDPKLLATPGVKILYSDYSNLIEGYEYDLTNNTEVSILESENQLIALAESYNLSYKDINIDQSYISISEGIIDTVKEYAQKVVMFIIGLFKKLLDMIRRFFNFIKEKFTGNKKIEVPKDKKVELPVIVSESVKLAQYQVTDSNMLESIVKKSIDGLQKEISKRQQLQTRATKQLADLTKRLQVKNESYDIFNEAANNNRKKVVDKTIDILNSLEKSPKIEKKEKDKFINGDNPKDSLCFAGLGYDGLETICRKVNKEIKQFNAKLTPDNYGTAFLHINEAVDSTNSNREDAINKVSDIIRKTGKSVHIDKDDKERFINGELDILCIGGAELLFQKGIEEIRKELRTFKDISFRSDRHSVFLYDNKKAVIKEQKTKYAYDDPYEVYNAYHLEKDYKNPEYACWDEEQYYPTMGDLLNASKPSNGKYHIYTDLGGGKTKYLGIISVSSIIEDGSYCFSYEWIKTVNEVSTILESNAAAGAIVGIEDTIFVHNIMKKNTFTDNEEDVLISRYGMNDMFYFDKGKPVKITREEVETQYNINSTYVFLDPVEDYIDLVKESVSMEDFFSKIMNRNIKDMRFIKNDIAFEQTETFQKEMSNIRNRILEEYANIKDDRRKINKVDSILESMIDNYIPVCTLDKKEDLKHRMDILSAYMKTI